MARKGSIEIALKFGIIKLKQNRHPAINGANNHKGGLPAKTKLSNTNSAEIATKQAKAVCKRCPITDECLRWALDNRERYGIWGGKSEYERRLILIAEAVDARALGRVG